MHRSKRLIIRDAEAVGVIALSGDTAGIEAIERHWGMALSAVIDSLWDEALEAGLLGVAADMENLFVWVTA